MKFGTENSYDVEEKIILRNIAILPVGAVEAHGPHLPLSTDNILAAKMAEKLAERVDSFVMPTLPYGQVWSLRNFPGSINVSNESLTAFITDIGKSLYHQGFRTFVIMNGHLGNGAPIKEAARKLYDTYRELKVHYFFYPGMNTIVKDIMETPASHASYFHACEIETSYMLHLSPENVDMKRAIRDVPDIGMSADTTPTPWEEFTKSAVLGDATLARANKGAYVIERVLDNMVTILQEKGGK